MNKFENTIDATLAVIMRPHAIASWNPQTLAKFVNMTEFTMVYGEYIGLVHIGFENQLSHRTPLFFRRKSYLVPHPTPTHRSCGLHQSLHQSLHHSQ